MKKNNKKEYILIVDDAPNTIEVLQRNLTAEGYLVFTAFNVADAIKILEKTEISVVITDLKMPKVSGYDLIRHVRENYKNTEVMVITGYPSIEGALKAVKNGAEEYLAKPFTDEELFSAVQRTFEKLNRRRLKKPVSYNAPQSYKGIIGRSPEIMHVFKAIDKASLTPATVLITGESGTGKELVARAIHYNSSRSSYPFVPVCCGSIPESLLESELFGHVKGAFTGATESKAGFFHAADGGTIFLDEIGEMSLSMQVKLLRVLQEKEVYMIGSNKTHKVDVHILAATNKNLRTLVEKGLFREDLFYRINVITIEVPPLRERKGDTQLLISHFVNKFSEELNLSPRQFSDEALQILTNFSWPGNIRELENVIQRLIIMSESDVIDVPDLPSLMRFSALQDNGLDKTLAEVEREHILNVLLNVNNNKTKAAEILGIDRKTLREKIKRSN